MIRDKYAHINPNFMPGEKFVAINKAGEVGASWSYQGGHPTMSVRSGEGASEYSGSNFSEFGG